MDETPWHRLCLRCGGEMEEGFVLDEAQSGYRLARWVAGPPQKSPWTGIKLGGRRKLPLSAQRCTACGAIDLYARESEK